MTASLQLIPLQGFPLVEPGDDIAALISASLENNSLALESGDVLVLAQKIVSKAEDRYVELEGIIPGAEAIELARLADKDPRQMEVLLRESREVVRVRPGVVIVEHNLGYVHANAGMDKSNIANSDESPRLLLLPEDSDASAARIRTALTTRWGVAPQIIINDSAGRAWRNGTVGIAIGSAGLEPVLNQIGDQDMFGNTLEVTEAAVADELAAAASLVMGQAAQGIPVVLARGAQIAAAETGSRSLLRDKSRDMFR